MNKEFIYKERLNNLLKGIDNKSSIDNLYFYEVGDNDYLFFYNIKTKKGLTQSPVLRILYYSDNATAVENSFLYKDSKNTGINKINRDNNLDDIEALFYAVNKIKTFNNIFDIMTDRTYLNVFSKTNEDDELELSMQIAEFDKKELSDLDNERFKSLYTAQTNEFKDILDPKTHKKYQLFHEKDIFFNQNDMLLFSEICHPLEKQGYKMFPDDNGKSDKYFQVIRAIFPKGTYKEEDSFSEFITYHNSQTDTYTTSFSNNVVILSTFLKMNTGIDLSNFALSIVKSVIKNLDDQSCDNILKETLNSLNNSSLKGSDLIKEVFYKDNKSNIKDKITNILNKADKNK